MAKRSRTIHEAVEAQVGRCRAAAISIDEALKHEAQPDPVLVECACLFRSVADELTKALAEGDVRRVKDLFSFSVGLANIAAPFVAVGIAIFQPAHQCLVEIRQDGEADGQMIEEAEEIALAEGAATIPITIDLSATGEAPNVVQGRASADYGYGAKATGTTVPTERIPAAATLTGESGAEATGRNLSETITDIVGIDDSVIADLAETAVSGASLDETAKGLAETVRGVVDPADVQALAETGRAVASGGDATVGPATIGTKANTPTPTAGQTIPVGTAEEIDEAGPVEFITEGDR